MEAPKPALVVPRLRKEAIQLLNASEQLDCIQLRSKGTLWAPKYEREGKSVNGFACGFFALP